MFKRKKINVDQTNPKTLYERNLPLILSAVESLDLDQELVDLIEVSIRNNDALRDYITNKAFYVAPELNPRGRICRIIFERGVIDLMNTHGVSDQEGQRVCSAIYNSLTDDIKRPI